MLTQPPHISQVGRRVEKLNTCKVKVADGADAYSYKGGRTSQGLDG